ncbi:hypothetical protein S40285_08072 [Stachybotrys chlorohalonatus IBT 40285]|uniref:Uncharacterized protein n=1 Tax=Stachybotrys chlorohalonatus (strain IBT 40285) TaxID=1283841 RepID=A0A084Q8G2_STAC4|nr:hypothetical protein S40285_08072 [Stachybotrys chlorohalonata IBT 40285]
MASISLKPRSTSSTSIFIKSQFLTKCRPPPEGTSLAGKTAVITGSNVGIGLAACRVMLQLGLSRLIMAVRTVEKGKAAAEPLRKGFPQALIQVVQLDMLSYESIQTFAKHCSTLPRLDVAILGAAVFSSEFKIMPTGHEEVFQVNYLSTTLLSMLLLPALKPKRSGDEPGRLTIISSSTALYGEFAHRDADPIIPSFDNRESYRGFIERYSTSKLLVLMLTHKLSDLVSAEDVIINTVDPAFVADTSLHRTFPGLAARTFAFLKRVSARSLEQGAWTYVDGAVVKGKESHGGFIVDFGLHPFHPVMYTTEGKAAMDRLWKETLNELRFINVEALY